MINKLWLSQLYHYMDSESLIKYLTKIHEKRYYSIHHVLTLKAALSLEALVSNLYV